MAYTPIEVEKQLKTLEILVDTREQPGRSFDNRVKAFDNWKRYKLDFGDYSGAYTDLEGNWISLENEIIIERKMDLNELANCFTRERKRFQNEFIRAYDKKAIIYLFIERDTWKDAYLGTYGSSGKFRSHFNPKSLVASINSWEDRYEIRTRFMPAELTGQMIKDVIFYHLKNKLLEKKN